MLGSKFGNWEILEQHCHSDHMDPACLTCQNHGFQDTWEEVFDLDMVEVDFVHCPAFGCDLILEELVHCSLKLQKIDNSNLMRMLFQTYKNERS